MAELSERLTRALGLDRRPVAVCLTDEVLEASRRHVEAGRRPTYGDSMTRLGGGDPAC